MEIKPVVGDNVEIDVIKENKAVINNILERKTYLKRPKVSNISQVIFVISPKMPSPNLTVLDKELCFAEFLGLNSIIVINKTDLDEKESDKIFNLYTKIGYKVVKTKAIQKEGIETLRKVLQNNTSVLAGMSGVREINYYQ